MAKSYITLTAQTAIWTIFLDLLAVQIITLTLTGIVWLIYFSPCSEEFYTASKFLFIFLLQIFLD